MRSIKDQIARGRTINASGMNAQATKFCGWALKKGREYCEGKSIIELRNEYEREEHYNSLPKYEIVASKSFDGKWEDEVQVGTLSELRIHFWRTLKMGSDRSKAVDLYPTEIGGLIDSLNNAAEALGVADKNKYAGKELED